MELLVHTSSSTETPSPSPPSSHHPGSYSQLLINALDEPEPEAEPVEAVDCLGLM